MFILPLPVRVRTESSLPEAVAGNQHRVRAARLVAPCERASKQWLRAEHRVATVVAALQLPASIT